MSESIEDLKNEVAAQIYADQLSLVTIQDVLEAARSINIHFTSHSDLQDIHNFLQSLAAQARVHKVVPGEVVD